MALAIPELLDHVLQHLSPADLVQCCLVSHDWQEQANPLVFRTVTLRTPNALHGLASILDKSNERRLQVQSATITSGPYHHKGSINSAGVLRLLSLVPHLKSLVLKKLGTDCTYILPTAFSMLPELERLSLSVTSDTWHQQWNISLRELISPLQSIRELSLSGIVLATGAPASRTEPPAPSFVAPVLTKLNLFALRAPESDLLWLISESANLSSLAIVDVDFPRLVAVHYLDHSLITVVSTSSSLLTRPGVRTLFSLVSPASEELVLGVDSRLLDANIAVAALAHSHGRLRRLGLPMDVLAWGVVDAVAGDLDELRLFLMPRIDSRTIMESLEALARCQLRRGARVVVVVGHGARLVASERSFLEKTCEGKGVSWVEMDLDLSD